IGANAFSVVGYADVDLTASTRVQVQGTGSFSTAGSLKMTTDLITGASGANQSISAVGALTVNAASSSPAVTVAGSLGASLTLVGASISENGNIILPSGSLMLHATAGDVTVGTTTIGGKNVGGTLDVSGTAQSFFDQTKYTSGGQITLTSD